MNMNEDEVFENPFNFRNIRLILPEDSQTEKNVGDINPVKILVIARFGEENYIKSFNSIQEARLFKVKFIADIKAEMAEIIMKGVFLEMRK